MRFLRWTALAAAFTLTLTGAPAQAGPDRPDDAKSSVTTDTAKTKGKRGILRAGGPTAVADSYIVVFKDSAVSRLSVAGKASELAARVGGKARHTYSHALRGFEINTTADKAKQLTADPAVAYV